MGKAEAGHLRIIGGRWRGRRLPIPAQAGLRPTTDRARETLFNWLAPAIEGSRCLDCFAGSGALGLEAASRGAAQVIMLERARAVVRQLERNAATLGAEQVAVYCADAVAWLASAQARPFDLCFLDPPFRSALLAPALAALRSRGWLAADALVYVETDKAAPLPESAAGWDWVRRKQAGQVCYGLLRPVAAPEPH